MVHTRYLMNAIFSNRPRVLICAFAILLVIGCTSDTLDSTEDGDTGTVTEQPAEPAESENFTLRLGSSAVGITEGQGLVNVPVNISRVSGFDEPISLTVDVQSGADDGFLLRQFSDDVLTASEPNSNLQLDLAIGPRPLLPHTRTLVVTATDASGRSAVSELALQIQPTSAPDLYLLIGQSNMIGISEDDARLAAPGQPDEPLDSIRQLNVTFNDDANFSDPRDFTDPARLVNGGNPLTVALDPLHAGLQSDGSKSGTRIGMGLSFAKRALADTSASIYLIPAAWSDTGFCKRDTSILPGIGWNATPKTNPAFSGTLLHDRAIARTNIALQQTGGILRGILWHQGEADSENPICAQAYADNLVDMVQSLRTNIDIDARGPAARGPDADIPFIVGTMAMGGEQAPFSQTKMLVDTVHRNIAQIVAFAEVANNDDLVPPAYPCGGGTCIHFGAEALREMGARYYERLLSVLD